jgi:hypothetical protein
MSGVMAAVMLKETFANIMNQQLRIRASFTFLSHYLPHAFLLLDSAVMRIHRHLFLAAAGLLAASAVAQAADGPSTAVLAPTQKEYVRVALDIATLVKVPSDTATLVIGNPIIADALLTQNSGGLLVLTGRSYGVTNIVALNSDGQPLREMIVRVQQAASSTVTVLRGTLRETLTCSPQCEQTLTLGDHPEFFNGSNAQIGARNAASGAK